MNRLNNLFDTDDSIDTLIHFLHTGRLPNEIKRNKYITKFRGFYLQNGKLMYDNREVIKKAEIEDTLNNLFENDNNTLAKGVTALYKYICSRYINITRSEVQAYLQNTPQYQMSKKFIYKTNKPITATTTNKLWNIDLIDMTNYVGHNTFNKYIFVCIDAFSRKVWLEKMRNKTAKTTAKALEKIIERAGISPSVILTDNGGEFQDEFETECQNQNIKHNFIPSHTPQANGLVERANKEIRKIIRAYMVKNNNQKWAIYLPEIEDMKNNTFHSLLKATPNEIWSANKDEIRLRQLDKKSVAKVNHLRHVKKQIKKFIDEDTFEVGDYVRVRMATLFSNIRKVIKSGNSKQIVVEYSPLIFQIAKVIIPRNNTLSRKRYILENEHGRYIMSQKGNIKHFYSSDLLLVQNEEQEANITMEDALKLNQVEQTRNDLVYWLE